MSMSEHVERLAARFDHHDPHFSDEDVPQHVYGALRDKCPVVHSDAHGGFWAVAGYEELVAVASDDETFAKRYGLSVPGMVSPDTPDEELASLRARIPSNQDPPEYQRIRRIYNPLFSPPKARTWEVIAREITNRLLEEVVDRGECDLVKEVFEPFTGRFILRFIGLDEDEWERFAKPVLETVHAPFVEGSDDRSRTSSVSQRTGHGEVGEDEDPQAFMPATYLEVAAERRAEPRDDLISHLVHTGIDGVPLTDEEIIANAHLVLVGGIDTTIGAMSGALLYLGRHPEQRARLVSEPELMPLAVEEFLRVFAPVTGIARMTTKDCVVAGQQLRRGDPVLLLYPSANRDSRQFPEPNEVIFDREPNRHLTFSAGLHRCPGSNFARMELRVMLEEVLRRIPDFEVKEAGVAKHADISIIDSYASLPISFAPTDR